MSADTRASIAMVMSALLAIFAGVMAGEATRWKRNAQESWDSNYRLSEELQKARWALDTYAATERAK